MLESKKTLLILTPLGSSSASWIQYFDLAERIHEQGCLNVLFVDIVDFRMNVNRWSETLCEVLEIILEKLNIGKLQLLGFGSGAGAWFKSGLASRPIFQTGINVLVDAEFFDCNTGEQADCAIVCYWSKSADCIRCPSNAKHIEVSECDFLNTRISQNMPASDGWLSEVLGHLSSPPFEWVTTETLISYIDQSTCTNNLQLMKSSRNERIKNLIESLL